MEKCKNLTFMYLVYVKKKKKKKQHVALFLMCVCVYVFYLAGQRERAFAGHDDPPAHASIRAKAFQPTCEFITFAFYHLIITSSDNLYFDCVSLSIFCM